MSKPWFPLHIFPFQPIHGTMVLTVELIDYSHWLHLIAAVLNSPHPLRFTALTAPGGVPTGQRLARAGRRSGERRAALQPGSLLREPRVASVGLPDGQRLRRTDVTREMYESSGVNLLDL